MANITPGQAALEEAAITGFAAVQDGKVLTAEDVFIMPPSPGQVAYEKFREVNADCVEWAELPPAMQSGWQSAAEAVIDEALKAHCEGCPSVDICNGLEESYCGTFDRISALKKEAPHG